MDRVKFSNISISEELKQGIADMGYDDATSIQSQSIPYILEGRDIIGRSQTGSGKTAAFALPAIDMLDNTMNPKEVQVLILCPTRELALQAVSEIKKFSRYKEDTTVCAVVGGDPIIRQIAKLRQGSKIVVGTPGRIMDHMRRKTIRISEVKMVVLDEADEMLNMGFVEDIETILATTPEDRQTILFSATMPSAVLEITKKFQKDPVMVEIEQAKMTVDTVEQYFFNIPKGQKTAALCRLLEYYKPNSSIIFCNTKKMVDELILELRSHDYPAQGLHGDMKQAIRSQVMNQFKNKQFKILVATDVAARGIDVNDIKIVFNFDLPQEDEYYVHRIGRTGRAGKQGQAFTFIQGGKQLSQLKNIMKYTKCEIVQKALPTMGEIRDRRIEDVFEKLITFMNENDCSMYKDAVEKFLSEDRSAVDIAAAFVAMVVKDNFPEDNIPADFNEFDLIEDSSVRAKRLSSRAIKVNSSVNSDIKKRVYDDHNMVSVKISVGRKNKITPNHILGAVTGETGLPGKLFGVISIQSTYSTIDVPKELKTMVVQKLNGIKIKGIQVTVS
ncbi:MAG: hypothetical protein A2Y17_10545 [Clostridiales bacterium GWF2_38_85]|nr:MAG: hypothetical protein A2Y17_10545 [Clostridiales bacterium GWF2_38_85]HBL84612.1 ATP-dependent RNA helicase [Clostridiales bacterium]